MFSLRWSLTSLVCCLAGYVDLVGFRRLDVPTALDVVSAHYFALIRFGFALRRNCVHGA